MNGKRASETVVTIAEVIRPNEANFIGKLFGGELLAKIDLCAYAASAKHSGTVCVTASFDQVDFHEPIEVGELVTLTGRVTFVGRSSMEVMVEVHAENLKHSVKRHTNTARVTMVAILNSKPIEVPRLICETRDEKILFLQGKMRRDSRKSLIDERAQAYDKIEHLTDAELDLAMQDA
jgi:acyl-CoA hydrolase